MPLWTNPAQILRSQWEIIIFCGLKNYKHKKPLEDLTIPCVNYVLCSHGQEETLQHLFFECEFSQFCWSVLHIVWNLSLSVMDMIK
jgi:hypothetical protein